MFTPDDRAGLRASLLRHAASDSRISGAALTGSAAADAEDRWSDIDLAFGIADPAQLSEVLSDFTSLMYGAYHAIHHTDVHAGPWLYRVFFLADTLQVDLAFVPATEFRALSPAFRLISGAANDPRPAPPADPASLIGLAWLYALHARSALARQKLWQAEYMISGVRDHALALACLRHNLPAVHARGTDHLPPEITAPFEPTLVTRLDHPDLSRAFRAAIDALLAEIHQADPTLAARLHRPLTALAR
jgi:hypothetical protein